MVSFSALRSFQEILNFARYQSIDGKIQRCSNQEMSQSNENSTPWMLAWKVWYNIGIESTKSPPDKIVDESCIQNDFSLIYIPSQQFLTALVQIFPNLFQHIKNRFVAADLQKLCIVLQNAIAVPVHGEASSYILPSLTEVILTPLQEAVLQVMDIVLKEAANGNETLKLMIPAIFNQLLVFSCYACHAPPYGKLRTRSLKIKQTITDWVTMNFVPFGEKALEMVVSLYQQTAQQQIVIQSQVLHSIVKTLKIPLQMKYSCPSQLTWKLAVNSLLKVLHIGLPVARQYPSHFQGMWSDLASAIEDFLFSTSVSPPTQSLEEQQCDEALDCKVVHMIRECILPYANQVPKEFIVSLVTLLNRGSIHSATSNTPVDTESSRRLREEFAKSCFETLLQFSFLGDSYIIEGNTGDTERNKGVVNKLAVTSLLHRFQEVIHKYAEDERLSGKCPLPRHRMAEISFVLKAVATLTASLKRAPPENVDWTVWKQLIALYPHLVDCTTSTSIQVCRSLREALHEYADLLAPPQSHIINGNNS